MGRLTKLLFPAVLLVAGYYAVLGGEYSLLDMRRARGELAAATAELDLLRVANDSLRALVYSLETEPAMLERLARERFGLIRDGEVLYRFAPADSANAESAGR